MYRNPHLTWVIGFVRQSEPALAIFCAGSACGIPYAPEEGFLARWFQLLSRFHRVTRQRYCALLRRAAAYAFGEPVLVGRVSERETFLLVALGFGRGLVVFVTFGFGLAVAFTTVGSMVAVTLGAGSEKRLADVWGAGA